MRKENLEQQVQEATKHLAILYTHMFLNRRFNENTPEGELTDYTSHIMSLYGIQKPSDNKTKNKDKEKKKSIYEIIKENAALETFKIFLFGDKNYLISHKETEFTLRDFKLARIVLEKFNLKANKEIINYVQQAISEYKEKETNNPSELNRVFGKSLDYIT